MSDRLYLSCRLQGLNPANLLRHFDKALGLFPFSRLAKRGPVLRVYALEHIEPPVVEREFAPGTPPGEIIRIAREFYHDDCSVEVEAAWDLWQYDGEWKLGPVPVTLSCFGPEFDDAEFDHVRVDLGPEALFLPDTSIEGSLRMGQSNLRSVVRFAGDLEEKLPLESRRLWSESGTNFAGTVAESLGQFDAN